MDIFSDILKVVWVSGKLSKWFVLKFAFFILRAKTPGTQGNRLVIHCLVSARLSESTGK